MSHFRTQKSAAPLKPGGPDAMSPAEAALPLKTGKPPAQLRAQTLFAQLDFHGCCRDPPPWPAHLHAQFLKAKILADRGRSRWVKVEAFRTRLRAPRTTFYARRATIE